MSRAQTNKPVRGLGTGLGLVSLMMLSLSGCASDPPKPAPTVTPDHVRSHSDNAFQKLKQEERGRTGDQTDLR